MYINKAAYKKKFDVFPLKITQKPLLTEQRKTISKNATLHTLIF